MKLERRHLATEDEGRLNWPQNNGAMYMVGASSIAAAPVDRQSTATPRTSGARRAAIASCPAVRRSPKRRTDLAVGANHLTVQNSSLMRQSAHFADTHLSVAVRKDSEPRAAHAWNAYSVEQPMCVRLGRRC